MNNKLVQWVTFLSLAAGLILQSVGAILYDTTAAERPQISFLWLVGPFCTFGVGLIAAVNYRRTRAVWIFEWIWFTILGLHAVRAAFLGGLAEAAMSFLSWGAWFCAYLWISTSPGGLRWIVRGVAGLFVVIGVVLATGVLLEAAFGFTLTKQTTIGEDIVRRYGFSQSIVNGGIEIGCGIVATMYFLVAANGSLRLLFVALVGYEWLGLLLTTARGPILLTLVATGIVSVIGLARRNPGIRTQTVFLGIAGFALLPVAVEAGWLSLGMIEYTQSSLKVDDVSNVLRTERMSQTVRMATDSVEVALFGIGAGETVVMPSFRGHESFTSESSALKLWLETGMVGFLTFYVLLFSAFFEGFQMYGRMGAGAARGGAQPLQQLCIMCCLGIVSIESMFHDMMTTWVISGVYWTALGALRAANLDAQDVLEDRSKSDGKRHVASLGWSAAVPGQSGVPTVAVGS